METESSLAIPKQKVSDKKLHVHQMFFHQGGGWV